MNNYFTLNTAYKYQYEKTYNDDIVENFNVSYAVRPSMVAPSKCCGSTVQSVRNHDMDTVQNPSPLGPPDKNVPIKESFCHCRNPMAMMKYDNNSELHENSNLPHHSQWKQTL